MSKEEFLDRLAGKPWVRLREIADKIEKCQDDSNCNCAALQEEGQEIFAKANGHPKQYFCHEPAAWRRIANRLEREDTQ